MLMDPHPVPLVPPLAKDLCLHRLSTMHSSGVFRIGSGGRLHGWPSGWLKHSWGAFKEKALSEVVWHTCILFLCVYKFYLAMERYIKPVAHRVKAPIFMRTASHENLPLFIINMHIFSRPLPCPLRHTHMHACTDSRKHLHIVLAQARPTMPCIHLVY